MSTPQKQASNWSNILLDSPAYNTRSRTVTQEETHADEDVMADESTMKVTVCRTPDRPVPQDLDEQTTKLPRISSPAAYEKIVHKRGEAQVVCDREKQDILYPGDFPLNVIPREDKLFEELNIWAKKHGFCLIKSSIVPGSRKKGERRRFSCFRSGSPRSTKKDFSRQAAQTQKCNCPWEIWAEEVIDAGGKEGWVVSGVAPSLLRQAGIVGKQLIQYAHNHEMAETELQKLACHHSFRGIPDACKEFAHPLVVTKIPPSKIYRALVEHCHNIGIPVTFTKQDVKNAFPKACSTLDCSDAIEYLQNRKIRNHLLDFGYYLDSDGVLERIFLVIEKGKELLTSQGQNTVVLYDTKHGTNRYGLKLGCFCSLDAEGKLRVIAASFLLHEDIPAFEWCFEFFSKSFGIPSVFFTDQDSAMASAVKTKFPVTVHLLCTFHIWKNFWKHLKPLFQHEHSIHWKNIASKWWELCKNSDSSMRSKFEAEFDNFIQEIEKYGSTMNPSVREWLSGLKNISRQWAACYTWSHTTYGVHSTQRAEALNSAIATFCNKGATMLEITRDLENLGCTQLLESELRVLRHQLYPATKESRIPPMAIHLGDQLSQWGKKLIISQVNLVHFYKVEMHLLNHNGMATYLVTRIGTPEDISFHEAKHVKANERATDHGLAASKFVPHQTSLLSCTCQYELCFSGLPCRHQCVLAQTLGEPAWVVLKQKISQFWYEKVIHDATLLYQDRTITETAIDLARTQGQRRSDIMALAGQLADVASTMESATSAIENWIKGELSRLDISSQNAVAIANPTALKHQKQSRQQPMAHAVPTTRAAKKAEQLNKMEQKKRAIALNAFYSGGHP